MFYKLVKNIRCLGGSISVAFEFISAYILFSLGYNARIAPSREIKYLTRNNLQNQLDLIYRTFLICKFGRKDTKKIQYTFILHKYMYYQPHAPK